MTARSVLRMSFNAVFEVRRFYGPTFTEKIGEWQNKCLNNIALLQYELLSLIRAIKIEQRVYKGIA